MDFGRFYPAGCRAIGMELEPVRIDLATRPRAGEASRPAPQLKIWADAAIQPSSLNSVSTSSDILHSHRRMNSVGGWLCRQEGRAKPQEADWPACPLPVPILQFFEPSIERLGRSFTIVEAERIL